MSESPITKIMTNSRRIVYIALIITYIGGVFIADQLHTATSVLAVIALIWSIFYVRGFTLYLSMAFLAAGTWILVNEQAFMGDYLESFRRMADIFTLLVVIRVLGFPIDLGGYSESIKEFVNREIKDESLLYITTIVIAYLMGMSILVAVIPVVYYIIERAVKENSEDPKKFLATAGKRGLFLVLLWTPTSASMAVALEAANASWLQVFVPGILLSLSGLLLTILIYRKQMIVDLLKSPVNWFSSSKADHKTKDATNNTSLKHNPLAKFLTSSKMISLICALFLLVITLAILDYLSEIGMLDLVIVVVVIFSFFWCLYLGQALEFFNRSKEFLSDSLPGFQRQLTLFISAGYFAGAISVGDDFIATGFTAMIEQIGAFGVISLLPVVIIVAAIIGIHPFISVTVLGEALSPLAAALPTAALAFSFILGLNLALLVSPFSAATLITSDLVKTTPYKAGVVWNGPFGAAIFIIGTVLMYLFYMI